jgi:hypothetical protein
MLAGSSSGNAATAANMEVIRHWDDETQTPQLVFVATRKIEIGDELLGQYGREYWNIMFQRLLQNHARFAAQTNERCKMLRKMILADTEWNADDLRSLEIKKLKGSAPLLIGFND